MKWDPLELIVKVGDLVWHDDYLLNEMGIVLKFDPPTEDNPFGEDYVWIFVIKGVNSGQKRWTKVKLLSLVRGAEPL
jgi:hypothetical protein|tara:strand:+ start:3887 stop:4117 length:231 start_codon:yes stop_codon:yes gene_type:complete